MTHEGRDFNDILKEATREGYAEADPSLDIDGVDAAHKLVIMVNLAYGTPVPMSAVYTEGISKISTVDIAFARELGFTIKLLGIAKCQEQVVEARVHPTLVPAEAPIAQVNGVYNAIHLVGDAVGDIVLYGQGGGRHCAVWARCWLPSNGERGGGGYYRSGSESNARVLLSYPCNFLSMGITPASRH
jgi:homoserine dehydrogenase